MKRRNKFLGIAVVALVVAAVADQLRRPAGERTWQGRVVGVPYDFRVPTPQRLRAAFWNEENPSLFSPRVVGIGWDLNFYRVLHPFKT